jgi:DNA-binding LacI/PurR family transcriptional regulator
MLTGTFTDRNTRSYTIKDVARLAGVSTATVSRVVNRSGRVSSERSTKVLSAISKLEYSPNAYAAELGRSGGGIPKKVGNRAHTLHGDAATFN